MRMASEPSTRPSFCFKLKDKERNSTVACGWLVKVSWIIRHQASCYFQPPVITPMQLVIDWPRTSLALLAFTDSTGFPSTSVFRGVVPLCLRENMQIIDGRLKWAIGIHLAWGHWDFPELGWSQLLDLVWQSHHRCSQKPCNWQDRQWDGYLRAPYYGQLTYI